MFTAAHRTRESTRRSEHGSVSVQAALVVVPALFVVLILALQVTFAWLAASAVQAAAENAADAASARDGTVAEANAAADRVLSATGYATVTSRRIEISDGVARVELTARAYQFLPVAWNVVGTAEAPIEQFRSSEERQ
jgi:Flp pilus assembly protein TadG